MSTQELPTAPATTPATTPAATPAATVTQPAQPGQRSGATRQTPEGHRLIQRIALLLGQRTSLSRVMLTVLSTALILALIGFAVHALWVATIIVMALGLGYLIANSRRDQTDAVNQYQEDELDAVRGS